MNIGDKVRLLHDKQQGIITRFLEKSVVEIEIEDGFRITVLRKEITVVNKEEDFVFGKLKREQEGNQPQIVGQSGIYMCFKPLPDNKVAMIFVNNTDLKVQLALFGFDFVCCWHRQIHISFCVINLNNISFRS